MGKVEVRRPSETEISEMKKKSNLGMRTVRIFLAV